MAAGPDIGDRVQDVLSILNQIRELRRGGSLEDEWADIETAIATFLSTLDGILNPA